MKIATFNINNVNKRLANLIDWLAQSSPDVVCLQELKCEQGAFPIDALRRGRLTRPRGRGRGAGNGVAILAKGAEPIVIRTELPGDPSDLQARYIEAAVAGVVIASIYLPNGNPATWPQVPFKGARRRPSSASLCSDASPPSTGASLRRRRCACRSAEAARSARRASLGVFADSDGYCLAEPSST